ncbi:MAG: tail fiber domain-containing protein [Proteobacteria bacterium]|nr:tail fiber domain-containing protein [Pseudomonadota bacterium]
MRKIALGAAAIALLAPSLAHADTNAVVGIDYNRVNLPFADADVYGISGAFNHDISGLNFQMDGYTGRASEGFCCLNTNYAAAHLGVRTDTYSAAGFIAEQSFSSASGINVGIEGQMFFPQAMIEGSLSYTDWSDFDLNATNVQVDGAWYFTPDFSVNALLGYTSADEGGTSGHFTSYGLSGEYRFADCPASISLGWRRLDGEGDHADTWSIGVTFDFGTGTLQDRTTKGPSWNGARSVYDNWDRTIGIVPLVSDRRLKRDITLLTTLANGMQIYSFRYLRSETVHVGVMAQDLLLNPAWRRAVVRQANGYFAVNYAALGLRMANFDDFKRDGVASVLCRDEELALAA